MSSSRESVRRVRGALPARPGSLLRYAALGAALALSGALWAGGGRLAHADEASDQAGRTGENRDGQDAGRVSGMEANERQINEKQVNEKQVNEKQVNEKAPPYRVDDVTQVFVGNPRQFKKPCVVSTDRVYRAIPEYQEILEKNLTDKDVRYHFLMRKASDKFSRAVQALARDQGYDLVAGKGAVSATSADSPAIPDGTDGTISRLPS